MPGCHVLDQGRRSHGQEKTVTFAPAQTVAVFTVTITDDADPEPNETVILGLANPSPADINIGTVSAFTLHIVNDDSRADLDRDGQVTGNDMVVLLLEIFDLDGTMTPDVPGSTNPGWDGYDLDSDGKVLGSDVAEEIKAFHE